MAEPTQAEMYQEEVPYGTDDHWLFSLTGSVVAFTGTAVGTFKARFNEIGIAMTTGMAAWINGTDNLRITTPRDEWSGASFAQMAAAFQFEKRDLGLQTLLVGSYKFKPTVALDGGSQTQADREVRAEFMSGGSLAPNVPDGEEISLSIPNWYR